MIKKHYCLSCNLPYDWDDNYVYATNVHCIQCGYVIIWASTKAQKLAIMMGQTDMLNNHNPLRLQMHATPPEEKDSVTETLKERCTTHGEFRENSAVSKHIRDAVICEIKESGRELTSYQEEAIIMISHKLARIACGNDKFADHWKDISGYAKLAFDRLEKDFPQEQ